MCFSPQANFILAALLLLMGSASLRKLVSKHRNYLPFAFIPLIFGFQQIIEGFLGLSLQKNGEGYVQFFGLSDLFFAFFLWPIYLPFSIGLIESVVQRKKMIQYLFWFGLVLAGYLYLPLATGFTTVTVALHQGCLVYDFRFSTSILHMLAVFYLLVTTGSMLLSSSPQINILGILNGVVAVAAYHWYGASFTSVWCFFAALLSFYIIYLMSGLRMTK